LFSPAILSSEPQWDPRWDRFFEYLNTDEVGRLFYPPISEWEGDKSWTLVNVNSIRENILGNKDDVLENLVKVYEKVFVAAVCDRKLTTPRYQKNVDFMRKDLIGLLGHATPQKRRLLILKTEKIFGLALGHSTFEDYEVQEATTSPERCHPSLQ